MSKTTTIKMRRDEPAHPGGPTEADVHSDEVQAFSNAGWELVQDRVDDIEEAVLAAVETMPKASRKPRSKAEGHK